MKNDTRSPVDFIKLASEAECELRIAVKYLCQKKRYSKLKPAQLGKKIQTVWEIPVPPTGATVKIFLSQRARASAFNLIPPLPDFEQAIKDFLGNRIDRPQTATERRSIKRVADNAWTINQARDRRALAGHPSPNRGRPEIYPPELVIAVHDHLAGCLGLKTLPFSRKSSDAKVENDGKPYGPELELWIATLYYLVCVIEAPLGSHTSPPRKPSPEALITTLKRRK